MPLKVLTLGSGVCANSCLPGKRRFPPGFLIDYNNQLLLLDVSEGVRSRLEDAGYDYGRLTKIAVTHVHPDHADLSPFLQAKLCRTLWGEPVEGMEHLDVYMPEISIKGFEDTWNWRHPEAGGKLNHMPEKFKFDIHPMRGEWEEEIFPGLKLKAFGVYHGFGQHPSLGFRVEAEGKSIVYTGDTGMVESLFKNVEPADLLIADCGVRIGQEYTGGYGHMGPSQCGMLAYRSKVKELWLTHYVGYDAPAAMEAEARKSGFTGTLKVATDGLEWRA